MGFFEIFSNKKSLQAETVAAPLIGKSLANVECVVWEKAGNALILRNRGDGRSGQIAHRLHLFVTSATKLVFTLCGKAGHDQIA